MLLKDNEAEKKLKRLTEINFWRREYRKLAVLKYFKEHPRKCDKYIKSLKNSIELIDKNFNEINKIENKENILTDEYRFHKLYQIFLGMMPISDDIIASDSIVLTLGEIYLIKLITKNKPSYIFDLFDFCYEHGIFPRDIIIGKKCGIQLIDEQKETDFKKFFFNGKIDEEAKLIQKSLLIKKINANTSVNFFLCNNSESIEKKKYGYLYLNKDYSKIYRDELKNDLREYFKNPLSKSLKSISRHKNTTSIVQIQYRKGTDKEQIIRNILSWNDSTHHINNYHPMSNINEHRTMSNGVYIDSTYSYISSEKEVDKINKKIGSNNLLLKYPQKLDLGFSVKTSDYNTERHFLLEIANRTIPLTMTIPTPFNPTGIIKPQKWESNNNEVFIKHKKHPRDTYDYTKKEHTLNGYPEINAPHIESKLDEIYMFIGEEIAQQGYSNFDEYPVTSLLNKIYTLIESDKVLSKYHTIYEAYTAILLQEIYKSFENEPAKYINGETHKPYIELMLIKIYKHIENKYTQDQIAESHAAHIDLVLIKAYKRIEDEYTPYKHRKINEARIELTSQNNEFEKTEIRVRAAGIIIWKMMYLEGKSFGNAKKSFVTYAHTTALRHFTTKEIYQINDCVHVAEVSIKRGEPQSALEAREYLSKKKVTATQSLPTDIRRQILTYICKEIHKIDVQEILVPLLGYSSSSLCSWAKFIKDILNNPSKTSSKKIKAIKEQITIYESLSKNDLLSEVKKLKKPEQGAVAILPNLQGEI